MKPVLEVNNIGKAYRDYGGEWRRVLSWFGLPLKPRAEHWTLRDISFSIHPGEAVGIVGQNGTGKSTLLKIITGTLKPSTGHVRLHGSIAAILELGMGFHPELTGRQNAFHAAGLMGYSREQINAVIGDIEAFAEIGEYFDQPVRTYSSGMHVRVAFSVATAFRPDILIIDEALSVG
ncbi:MAG TPA: ABC transporter ATP-binding protein, partial [bacterium]|nr:ABC transporter ATP-binding protein [bacterium]